MPMHPGMWILWGILLVLTIAVKMYIARLSRDEDDQIVLQDAFEHIKAEQAAITARVNRVQPVQRVLLILLGAMTLYIVGYYIFDMVRQFR